MRNLLLVFTAMIAGALAACSGGDNTLFGPGGGPGGAATDAATLRLLTSSPQIPSDGTANATITALVRDTNNNVLADVPVLFTASSGSLVVSQPATTDENGVLTATLSTAGDPTNRTISVTATTGDLQAAVSVNVIGTSLVLNGPTSLPLGDVGNYTVVLASAGGTGIGNTQVTITSANGNGISQTPLLTDAQGRAAFSLSANNGGIDTLTADALGIQTQVPVNVSSDAFGFTAPAANTEIPLNTAQSVTVNWQIGGAPVADGRQVTFSTTRGALNPANGVVLTAGGNATVQISATNAGPALITATSDDGTTTQLNVEFVATVADTIELQANPFTVATNDQSTITAIVRDPAGNLVKNKTVVFQLDDITNGSLSVAQAQTNSQGRAQTFYNASSTTSASNGVKITGYVQDTPAVTDSVNLTVAQRELFISIGTGNSIDEPNTAQYHKEWVVQVTDSQGNGVDLAQVSLSVLSQRFWEGTRVYLDPPGTWVTRPGFEAFPHNGVPAGSSTHPSGSGCIDEDINNRNGVLDAGEDLNGNGRIEAGNIVTAVANGGGNTLITDANGFGIVDVYWPQEYAYWLEVTLEARTSVQGTEYAEGTTFLLTGSADDFNNESMAPPGVTSPFGTDGECATPPPPDGP